MKTGQKRVLVVSGSEMQIPNPSVVGQDGTEEIVVRELVEENKILRDQLKNLINYAHSVKYWMEHYQPLEMKTQKQTFQQFWEKVKQAEGKLIELGEEPILSSKITSWFGH